MSPITYTHICDFCEFQCSDLMRTCPRDWGHIHWPIVGRQAGRVERVNMCPMCVDKMRIVVAGCKTGWAVAVKNPKGRIDA